MRVKSLSFSDPQESGWVVEPFELKPGMNLFVGASGSGKTRVLNILFNIGLIATHDRFFNGQWTVGFQHSGVDYAWKYDGRAGKDESDHRVVVDELWVGTVDHVQKLLFKRSDTAFSYEGRPVPKLSPRTSGIFLLKEEDSIKPIHEGFSRIMRRRFWSEDLSESMNMRSVPRQILRKLDKRQDIHELFTLQPLHLVLFFVERYFKREYELIVEQFKRVFPFVDRLEIQTAGEGLNIPIGEPVPMVLVKERGIQKPIPLNEIASGMQKVLLILVDVITSPGDIIYMIDEYENSLGINAIDFLPPFVTECGGDRQFVVTTHHPHLINAIPVADWFVFHRKGMNIRVTQGREIEERYGKSKQRRFTQLLNDPLYAEGVE